MRTLGDMHDLSVGVVGAGGYHRRRLLLSVGLRKTQSHPFEEGSNRRHALPRHRQCDMPVWSYQIDRVPFNAGMVGTVAPGEDVGR